MEIPMERRRFLGRLVAALGGLAVVPAMATNALARSSRRRGFYYGGGWGGYGYGGYRGRLSSSRRRKLYRQRSSDRRFYGPRYGYPGYAPRSYYAPAPGYFAPPPPPVFYGPPGGYFPPFSRLNTPARDALALLET